MIHELALKLRSEVTRTNALISKLQEPTIYLLLLLVELRIVRSRLTAVDHLMMLDSQA